MKSAIFGMYLSFVLLFLSFTSFKEIQYLGTLLIVLSIALLVFSLYRMCKVNEKIKNTILRLFDLIFWRGN